MKSKEFLNYIKNKNNSLEFYKYNFGKILKERAKGKIIKNSGNGLSSQSTGINKENEINNSKEKSFEKITHIISDKSMKNRLNLKDIKKEKGILTDREKKQNINYTTNLRKSKKRKKKKITLLKKKIMKMKKIKTKIKIIKIIKMK